MPNGSLATAILTTALLLASAVGCASSSSNANQQNSSVTDSSSANSRIYSSGSATQGGLTSEETIVDLDKELDESIAEYDDMIQGERGKAEAIAGSLGTEEAGVEEIVDPNETLFEEGDLNEGLPGYGDFPEATREEEATQTADADVPGTGSPEGTDNPESTASTEATESSADQSASTSGSGGGIPQDVGSGGDDDIVARQIREAAQKEKDPQLREKLWDEYRKYKNQQGGS